MRVVLQRCTCAEVRIDGQTVGHIGKGFMCLVGITEGDTTADADLLTKKVAQMRVFDDEQGKMNLALKDVGGAILSISQFTLYADCRKGNRPSYIEAAGHEKAVPLYEEFCSKLSAAIGRPVGTGEFGADMKVSLLNDGPVTICIDYKNR